MDIRLEIAIAKVLLRTLVLGRPHFVVKLPVLGHDIAQLQRFREIDVTKNECAVM